MDDALALPALLLSLSAQLVREMHAGVTAHGFTDLRPAHGYAFARIARGDATTADVAAHLDITKQAAAQLVEELVRKGYLERRPHPRDARARLLALTERGWAVTRAADDAARAAAEPWRAALGPARFAALVGDLTAVQRAASGDAAPRALRPLW